MLREVWSFVEAKQRAGHQVALARLVARDGPGARPLGALLAACSDGDWSGSLSGGCVETAVLAEARELLGAGASRVSSVRAEDVLLPWEIGSACSALLQVLVTPAPTGSVARSISQALRHDEPLVVRTELVHPFAWDAHPPRDVESRMLPGSTNTYSEVLEARPLLLIVGATELAAALARLAGPLARRVVVLDPRHVRAPAPGPPDADQVICAPPGEWLLAHPLAPQDAALLVTEDAHVVDAALRALLPGAAGHVAVVGDRAAHFRRRERLADVAGIDRLVGPAGLDLGGTTPAEVALSLLAEVVAVTRGRSGGRLCDGAGPVQPH